MLKNAHLDSHVECVRDGKAALDRLTHNEAKIEELVALFLDLNIPAINGLELLAIIRGDDRLLHLPVIIMTSSNSPEDYPGSIRLASDSLEGLFMPSYKNRLQIRAEPVPRRA